MLLCIQPGLNPGGSDLGVCRSQDGAGPINALPSLEPSLCAPQEAHIDHVMTNARFMFVSFTSKALDPHLFPESVA